MINLLIAASTVAKAFDWRLCLRHTRLQQYLVTRAGVAGSESAQQRCCCTLRLRPESQQLRRSCMANKQLSIVLYRTVWRWARAANGVPYHLRFEDVCTVAPACLQPIGDAICAPSVPLQESAAVRAIARRAFRDSAHLQVEGSLTPCASHFGVWAVLL